MRVDPGRSALINAPARQQLAVTVVQFSYGYG